MEYFIWVDVTHVQEILCQMNQELGVLQLFVLLHQIFAQQTLSKLTVDVPNAPLELNLMQQELVVYKLPQEHALEIKSVSEMELVHHAKLELHLMN